MLTDTVLIIYATAICVDLYGVCLFTWWWIKMKRATFVFGCVDFLLLGDALDKIPETYSRYLRVSGRMEEQAAFVCTPFWKYRLLIESIATIAVLAYLTRRVLKGNFD